MRRFRCGKRCRGFAVFHRRFHKFAVYRYTVFSLCRNGYFHRYVGKQRRLAVDNRLPVYREACAVRHGNIGLLRNDRFGKRSKRILCGDRRIKSVRARHVAARSVRESIARKILRPFYRIERYTVYIERKLVFWRVVCEPYLNLALFICGNLVGLVIVQPVVSVHTTVRRRSRRKELHGVVVFVLYGNAVARPLIVVRVDVHVDYETASYGRAAHVVRKHIGRVVRRMRSLNFVALAKRHVMNAERIQRDIVPRIIDAVERLIVGIDFYRRRVVFSVFAAEHKRIFPVYGNRSAAYLVFAFSQHRKVEHTCRSRRAADVQQIVFRLRAAHRIRQAHHGGAARALYLARNAERLIGGQFGEHGVYVHAPVGHKRIHAVLHIFQIVCEHGLPVHRKVGKHKSALRRYGKVNLLIGVARHSHFIRDYGAARYGRGYVYRVHILGAQRVECGVFVFSLVVGRFPIEERHAAVARKQSGRGFAAQPVEFDAVLVPIVENVVIARIVFYHAQRHIVEIFRAGIVVKSDLLIVGVVIVLHIVAVRLVLGIDVIARIEANDVEFLRVAHIAYAPHTAIRIFGQ